MKEDADDEMAVEDYNELVAALNSSLVTNVPQMEEELQIDEFPTVSFSISWILFYFQFAHGVTYLFSLG